LKRYNVEMGMQRAIGCRWPQDAQAAQEGASRFTLIGFNPFNVVTVVTMSPF